MLRIASADRAKPRLPAAAFEPKLERGAAVMIKRDS
jgi:hypothetical protein